MRAPGSPHVGPQPSSSFKQGTPKLLRTSDCDFVFEWETPLVCPDEVTTEGCSLTDEQLSYSFNLSSLSKSTFKVRGPGAAAAWASLTLVFQNVAPVAAGGWVATEVARLVGSGSGSGEVRLALRRVQARPVGGSGRRGNQSRLTPERPSCVSQFGEIRSFFFSSQLKYSRLRCCITFCCTAEWPGDAYRYILRLLSSIMFCHK